ncbi:MAG: peroxide stress protein YaaA [Rhodospirillales bacterium]|jgi:uncharacterized protein|nr:peroxide stress protein YaaA [Rhodospirillales bacterium]MBT4038972.1 peroxide stress protein YaaA [Rhodospirillales bacterium]MBT4626644.1 peroxide stress protein YaaA [Rhodospirillales bacterium]MBT5351884.1 peroxide stress protein YaaA [Rhodospirillales bacterium]MBT5520628.1 peroxide stress protein YaaA [Rhodospirillales bacterium]
MLAVVSPAKKMNFDHLDRRLPSSEPEFLSDTKKLVTAARKLSRSDLQNLMKLSDSLAEVNFQRFKNFKSTPGTDDAKPAAFAFAGDTYVGLESATLDDKDLDYAQDHLRILSGLYGLLRPLDQIQPYRLEMGRRLDTPNSADLYDFWGPKLGNCLDDVVADHKSSTIINLASIEYFKATQAKSMKSRVITPTFKEIKDGEAKVIGFFAKKARGSMARYLIQNRIEEPEGLKSFDTDGYVYRDDLSEGDAWTFTRGA